MAKRVATDMKIELKSTSGPDQVWQDISDHVQRVELDYPVGDLVLVHLTIQADKNTILLNGSAPWEGDGVHRLEQAIKDKQSR